MSKILLVDDDPGIRHVYKKWLMYEGYDVLEAADCEKASQILVADKNVDLVLLDLCLPKFDGDVLYQLIQMLDPKVKVIIASVRSLVDQKKRIQKANDYYDKSENVGVLLEKVKHALEEVPNV